MKTNAARKLSSPPFFFAPVERFREVVARLRELGGGGGEQVGAAVRLDVLDHVLPTVVGHLEPEVGLLGVLVAEGERIEDAEPGGFNFIHEWRGSREARADRRANRPTIRRQEDRVRALPGSEPQRHARADAVLAGGRLDGRHELPADSAAA